MASTVLNIKDNLNFKYKGFISVIVLGMWVGSFCFFVCFLTQTLIWYNLFENPNILIKVDFHVQF